MTDLSGQYFGRYYLAERLGEGGMAVVYKAYDTRLERDVALKIIRSDAFPVNALDEMLKRFEREAKSLAKLSHPNIVKVYDYGEHDGSPFLVMEYLPGGTLKKVLGRPIPWQEAVRLILPVARGVAYAHKRGILHRDIKPANVLITDDGEPMLSDFGIAKLFEADQTTALTGSGMAIGTPEYMAPEQWTGTTSPQSDLYSLGIVLYELLTGRKPYEADTPAAILIKQATEPLPSPRAFAPDLPDVLERILIKVLAKEPEHRYPNLNDLVRELDELQTAMPTVIHQPTETVVDETYKIPVQKSVFSLPVETQTEGGATIKAEDVPETQTVTEPQGTKNSALKTAVPLLRKRMGILLGVVGIAIVAVLWSLSRDAAAVPTPAVTSTLTATKEVKPSPAVTITATTFPNKIVDSKGITMRLVPAGEFTMGMNTDDALNICHVMFTDCTIEQFVDEAPSHTVDLDAYYMDQYEATNANYKTCVDAGACEPPTSVSSGIGNNIRPSYYGEAKYDNYPVVNVSWRMAEAYCSWRGGRLPSEAEWEKAARGTDGRIFPWGSAMVDSTFSNYNHALGDTIAIGQYQNGQSPYGIYDLAGNVDEWTADWYAAYPGQDPNALKNFGESYRVVRGGNWDSNEIGISSVNRDWRDPALDSSRTGFRCVNAVVSESTVTPGPATENLPAEIKDDKGVEMVLVPEGEFTMGSDNGEPNEKPVHKVFLDTYYIDKYEVTNAFYKACVDAGVCDPTTRSNRYADPQYVQHPVIYVEWDMANEYCIWRGARLPTEAEWEKAARGADQRTYPWGEGVNELYANFTGQNTTPVGSYSQGVSPFGVYDMAGNVSEWVADWYSDTYYVTYPADQWPSNPTGPQSGTAHITRGGAWNHPVDIARTTSRGGSNLHFSYYSLGFRCALSADASVPRSVIPQTPEPVVDVLPTQITDYKGIAMMLVPAGEFTMGSDRGTEDSKPSNNVYLDTFYIDKYEITNALYKACQEAGICQPPQNTGSHTHSLYYGYSEFDNYPVVFVDWHSASTYCEWRDARLPTEAEWEKAARGTDGREYAWGSGYIDSSDMCKKANYLPCKGDTRPVGSYEEGKSAYGIYDLTGNVDEWTSSVFMGYPYNADDGREKASSTDDRVYRGGSFENQYFELMVYDRWKQNPNNSSEYLGFRCAKSAP